MKTAREWADEYWRRRESVDFKGDPEPVLEAVIGEAPTIKRVRPKARGSAGPIRKRNSHIRIVLTDEVPIVRRSDKPKSTGKAKAKKATVINTPSEAVLESNA
jgi:hypothetical protein